MKEVFNFLYGLDWLEVKGKCFGKAEPDVIPRSQFPAET